MRVMTTQTSKESLNKLSPRLIEIIKELKKAGIGSNTIANLTRLNLKTTEVERICRVNQ